MWNFSLGGVYINTRTRRYNTKRRKSRKTRFNPQPSDPFGQIKSANRDFAIAQHLPAYSNAFSIVSVSPFFAVPEWKFRSSGFHGWIGLYIPFFFFFFCVFFIWYQKGFHSKICLQGSFWFTEHHVRVGRCFYVCSVLFEL